MPTVLLYNLTGIKAAQLQLLCRGQKLLLRSVLPGEYQIPLGALVGRPTPLTKKGEGTVAEEMMVLVDLSEMELDRFLQAYRESGIAPVSLKAVLTPHNQGWDSVALYRELIREREEFLRKRMEKSR